MAIPLILAIDPGNVKTGWVLYDPVEHAVLFYGDEENEVVKQQMQRWPYAIMAIEMMRARGMPTANEEMETLVWIGRFIEAWGKQEHRVFRSDVKLHLCGSVKAKDANVRQAIIDLFPASGGGKVRQIGTKKLPGPLFGIAGDMWSALGIAITAAHQLKEKSHAIASAADRRSAPRSRPRVRI